MLPGDKSVQVVERPDPTPGPTDVVVATKASAICRSDMSIYYGRPLVGGSPSAELVVPGHEAAGIVTAVGSAVDSVSVGDRVAGYLAVADAKSPFTTSGYPMLDPDWRCFGFDFDGGDADYFSLPARNCLPLPAEVTFGAGAVLTDMVGTQFALQRRLGVSARHDVLVSGVGPMGAAAVMIAKAFGARVLAVDVVQSRLDMATALGADEVIDGSERNVPDDVRTLTAGRGADVVVECSGSPKAQNDSLDSAAALGHVAWVGESNQTEIRPSDQILRKLLTVSGGWYFPRQEWPELIRFVVSHGLDVERMVSHRFDLSDAPEAFDAFDRRATDKVLFTW